VVLRRCFFHCFRASKTLLENHVIARENGPNYKIKCMISAFNTITKEAYVYMEVEKIKQTVLQTSIEGIGATEVHIDTFSRDEQGKQSMFNAESAAALFSVHSYARKHGWILVERPGGVASVQPKEMQPAAGSQQASLDREAEDLYVQERVTAENPRDFDQEPASDDDDDDDASGSDPHGCCGKSRKRPAPERSISPPAKKYNYGEVNTRLKLKDAEINELKTSMASMAKDAEINALKISMAKDAEINMLKASMAKDAEISMLKTSMAAKITEGVQAALNDTALTHGSELAEKGIKLKKAQKAGNDEHRAALKAKDEEWETKLAAKDTELGEALKARDAKHKAELDAHARAALKARSDEYTAELDARVKAALGARDAEHETVLEARDKEWETKLAAKDTKLEEELKARDAKHKTELDARAKAAIEASNNKLKGAMEAKNKEWETKLAAKDTELQEALDAKDNEHKALTEYHEAIHRHDLAEQMRDAQAAIEARDAEHKAALEAKDEELNTEMAAKDDQLEAALKARNDEHKTELDAAARVKAALEAKNQEWETRLKEVISAKDTALNAAADATKQLQALGPSTANFRDAMLAAKEASWKQQLSEAIDKMDTALHAAEDAKNHAHRVEEDAKTHARRVEEEASQRIRELAHQLEARTAENTRLKASIASKDALLVAKNNLLLTQTLPATDITKAHLLEQNAAQDVSLRALLADYNTVASKLRDALQQLEAKHVESRGLSDALAAAKAESDTFKRQALAEASAEALRVMAIAAKDKGMAAKTVEFKAAEDKEMAAKNVELETTRVKLNEATAKNDLLAANELLINAEKAELQKSKSEFAKTVRILQTERESFRSHLETANADLKERTEAAALKETALNALNTDLDIRRAALNTREQSITWREREDEDRNLKAQRKVFTFTYMPGARFDPSEFNALDAAVQIDKAQGCTNGIVEYCVVTLAMGKRFKVFERLLDRYYARDRTSIYGSLYAKENIGHVSTTELAVRQALEAGTAWEWAAAAPPVPAV